MASAETQPVEGGLTRAAIFVVLTVKEGDDGMRAVRSLFGDLASIIRAVGFRSQEAGLTCVTSVGSAFWDRFEMGAKPAGLHPFREIKGVHNAVSTPGDILFHVRASRIDFCFELVTHIMDRLRGVVVVQDETHGFKFFDNRDLTGFVDGTENPTGTDLVDAVVIGDEDPAFAGGSYVIVQKYLHDLEAWNAIPVERQELIIGRHKLSDIELLDAEKPAYAHNVLNTIYENGRQLEILRDNMPFGTASKGEFGTYFIGYAREPGRIERMLDNMFKGSPPGNYDRLLDVSRAVTGSLFFVPSADLLESLATAGGNSPDDGNGASPTDPNQASDGSLGLGSMKNGG